MNIKSLVLAALLAGTALATPSSSDMSVLSRRVVDPLSRQELQRHMSPSLLTRNSHHTQTLSADTTRLSYVYTVQLADGSLMKVPENYQVTRTGQHVRQGVYPDLTVYAVRQEGSGHDLIVVGLTPTDQVIVLGPHQGAPLPGE